MGQRDFAGYENAEKKLAAFIIKSPRRMTFLHCTFGLRHNNNIL